MAREQNIATQEKAGEHFAARDYDAAVDTLFAPDCVDHDPAPDQGPGREGFRTFFRTLYTGFPDAAIEPQTVVADEEHVCLAYTLSGTHQGEFQGIASTGRRIEVRGVQIGRFRDGQIVERWGSTDELGIMKQLGVGGEGAGKPGLMDKVKDALRS